MKRSREINWRLWFLIGNAVWALASVLAGDAHSQVYCPNGNCPLPYAVPYGSPYGYRIEPPRAEQYPDLSTEPTPSAAHHAAVVQVSSQSGAGSGVLVASSGTQGIVFTCKHVLQTRSGGYSLSGHVEFSDGQRVPWKAIDVDPQEDLAALLIESTERITVTPIPVSQVMPQDGEEAELCGYGGGSRSLRHLRCLALGTGRWGSRGHAFGVRPISGDSGGPVIVRGFVVGIVWGGPTQYTNGPIIAAHAVPCNYLRAALQRIARRFPWATGRPLIVQPEQEQPPLVDITPPASKPGAVDKKLAELEAELAKVREESKRLADQLAQREREKEQPALPVNPPEEQEPPADTTPPNNPPPANAEKEKAPPKKEPKLPAAVAIAAESWIDAKVTLLLIGAGAPGWLAAGGLWLAKRGLKKRLAEGGKQSPVQPVTIPFPAAPTPQPILPQPIVHETPPPPQTVRTELRHSVIEGPNYEAQAWAWAIDQTVRREPNLLGLVQRIKSLKEQYLSGLTVGKGA